MFRTEAQQQSALHLCQADDKMRASCGWDGTGFKTLGDECGIMQCGGKVVKNARSDGHTIHGTPALNRPFVDISLEAHCGLESHLSITNPRCGLVWSTACVFDGFCGVGFRLSERGGAKAVG